MNNPVYDCAIIGGGLAGLTLAIQLADSGRSVVLFEKERYPFHRVCGEYISMESYPFLLRLGLPLDTMNVSRIDEVGVSSPNGNYMMRKLDLGGFGISRMKLDALLAEMAKSKGVVVKEGARVDEVSFNNDLFTIRSGSSSYISLTACGSFGKKSLLDRKLERQTGSGAGKGKNNFVAIKYHVRLSIPENRIELHNFRGGYCGVSKIEDDKCCLCYLTESTNLRENGNNILALEKNVLMRNPFLKDYFSRAEFLYPEPLAISQISFGRKTSVDKHLLMAGDAAGTITPLCGNGMSMAMRASFLAAELTNQFLDGRISRNQMEVHYKEQWDKLFLNRIRWGRSIQYFFGHNYMTNRFLTLMKHFPTLSDKLIATTHGEIF
jgi:flavin-dependent dehydrogenase